MKERKSSIQERVSSLKEACKASGAKLTQQRLEIFKEVIGSTIHPDAETILNSLSGRMPTLSLDTVYRTLWWLRDLGMLTTIGSPRESTRFDSNLEQHHHFVCSKCGLIQDFVCESFNSLELPDQIRNIGKARRVQVEVKGICLNCESEKQN